VSGAAPGLLAALLSTACAYYLFFRSGAGTPGAAGLVLFVLETTGLCLLTAIFRQRIVETEANLGRVFEDAPIGILILQRGPRILKANPAFGQILRAKNLPVEGQLLTDFVHPDSRERVCTFLDHLTQQQTVDTLEEVCLVKDTAAAWANLRGSWIRESSDMAPKCMVMVEDITERRRIEEALRSMQLRLERGQRIEAIGMFAGGIAHDFNNLLAVVFSSCERVLLQKDLPLEARGYTEEILKTAKTAADLTHQLLAFARQQPRSNQLISVNCLVRESSALLQRLLGPRIELKAELAPDVGTVRADPSQLQQILMNLAANARDAMLRGGCLTIRTSQTNVQGLGAVETKRYVMLQVSDTGPGMDEPTRAHIFEPFFSTKDLEHGTGLGLATVHSIVTKLGGHIDVESSPGNGACFSIHLPDAGSRSEESSPRSEETGKIEHSRS
jgi:PAS domain S-box-containing protein